MDIMSLYKSEYLRATDLKGAAPVLTIRSLETIELGASREEKGVLFFDGKEKGLVLNKVNATAIADMFGPETENWLGEKIVLFETTTEYQGRTVPAIRVRMAPAVRRAAEPAKAAAIAALIDDDIPF